MGWWLARWTSDLKIDGGCHGQGEGSGRGVRERGQGKT